ncbi:MAG TPA: DUF4190 domain-containing protein [Phycisphaerae bacterium]|nr:DUF4190 domain-containing protein [Phycisphaerae bacterium]
MTQPPPDPATLAAPPLPESPKASGLTIAALVCSIAGICTCGLGGIVGLILGIVALRKIGASGGTMGGRGIAIAAIIVGGFTLIIGALFLGVPLLLMGFRSGVHDWTTETWEKAKEDDEEDATPFFGEELNRAPDFPERRPAAPWLAPALEERRLAFAAVAAVPTAIV